MTRSSALGGVTSQGRRASPPSKASTESADVAAREAEAVRNSLVRDLALKCLNVL